MNKLDRLLREGLRKSPRSLEALARELTHLGYGVGRSDYQQIWERIQGEGVPGLFVKSVAFYNGNPKNPSKTHLGVQEGMREFDIRHSASDVMLACQSWLSVGNNVHPWIFPDPKEVLLEEVCKSCLRSVRVLYRKYDEKING